MQIRIQLQLVPIQSHVPHSSASFILFLFFLGGERLLKCFPGWVPSWLRHLWRCYKQIYVHTFMYIQRKFLSGYQQQRLWLFVCFSNRNRNRNSAKKSHTVQMGFVRQSWHTPWSWWWLWTPGTENWACPAHVLVQQLMPIEINKPT